MTSVVGGLSMSGITDEMLPELIGKTDGLLRTYFEEVRLAYLDERNPDLGPIVELCARAGVQLIQPEPVDWSGLNLD
jgi:hypothetical protein